jgi:hypothetical protein
VSYLGFGYGAAVSWGFDANVELDVATAVSHYAFADKTGAMGKLAYDLGNAYLETGTKIHNMSLLFAALEAEPADGLQKMQNMLMEGTVTAEGFSKALAFIDGVMAGLDGIEMNRADADLIKQEYGWTADMLRHAVHRANWMMAGATTPAPELTSEADRLIAEYEAIWHARNRPGGFVDSVTKMGKIRQSYGV